MIILFGLAGSGKGTQGKALSEIFGWRWISTGQLIRESGEFDEIINQGNMISDEDIERLLQKELEVTEAEGYNVILDGFPRDVKQAEWLLGQENQKVEGAIILEVPREELYKRLYMRAGLDGRVDDQEKTAIERRFEIFDQNIGAIVEAFVAKGVPVVRVDGVGMESEVTERLVEVVKGMDESATEQKDDVNGEEIEKSYGE